MIRTKEAQIKNGNIVVDCDEILVNISPKWTRKIYENRDIFEPYFDFEVLDYIFKESTNPDQIILMRNKFRLNQWLCKDGIDIPEEILLKFIQLYTDDIEFYKDLKMTKMAYGIQRLALLNEVKNVYVVSRIIDKKNLLYKEQLIRAIFPKEKLTILWIEGNKSKLEAIKDIDMSYGMIFEDELSNIEDYVYNGENIHNCEIWIPTFGYNEITEELFFKSREKDIMLSLY